MFSRGVLSQFGKSSEIQAAKPLTDGGRQGLCLYAIAEQCHTLDRPALYQHTVRIGRNEVESIKKQYV